MLIEFGKYDVCLCGLDFRQVMMMMRARMRMKMMQKVKEMIRLLRRDQVLERVQMQEKSKLLLQ